MPSNSRKSNEPAAKAADAADGRKGAEDNELIGQVRSGQDLIIPAAFQRLRKNTSERTWMRSTLGVGNMTSGNWILIIRKTLSGMGCFPNRETTTPDNY